MLLTLKGWFFDKGFLYVCSIIKLSFDKQLDYLDFLLKYTLVKQSSLAWL